MLLPRPAVVEEGYLERTQHEGRARWPEIGRREPRGHGAASSGGARECWGSPQGGEPQKSQQEGRWGVQQRGVPEVRTMTGGEELKRDQGARGWLSRSGRKRLCASQCRMTHMRLQFEVCLTNEQESDGLRRERGRRAAVAAGRGGSMTGCNRWAGEKGGRRPGLSWMGPQAEVAESLRASEHRLYKTSSCDGVGVAVVGC